MRRQIFPLVLVGLLAAVSVPTPTFAVGPGSLIKLACPAGAGSMHPCRSVYYWGADGYRHAFPSDKVYRSWYADFSGVNAVSAALLAAVPLDDNVTYRPGTRLVKFATDPTVYAVSLGGTLRAIDSESAAAGIYGNAWATYVDDVPDVLFGNYVFGADVKSPADFDRIAEQLRAPTINDNLPSTHRALTVQTVRGAFTVDLVKLQRARYRMITDTGNGRDCDRDCAVRPLADYVLSSGAEIGMNGSYFCPPDYADCANKLNSFLWPFFDSDDDVMVNAKSLEVHEGPMLAYTADGLYRFFHRTADFGKSVQAFEAATRTTLEAAASNYPSLVEDGAIIVESESRLDPDMRTVKGTRTAIGIDDSFVSLVVARAATVPDLAEVMRELGARDAFNMDGGGSTALWYGGGYVLGPGRLLPSVVLFRKK